MEILNLNNKDTLLPDRSALLYSCHCPTDTITMSLAKPQLRGLLGKQIKFNLTVGISMAVGMALAWKYFVGEPRKKAYRDFYATYDAEKDFERMRALGLFQSCRPDGAEEE